MKGQPGYNQQQCEQSKKNNEIAACSKRINAPSALFALYHIPVKKRMNYMAKKSVGIRLTSQPAQRSGTLSFCPGPQGSMVGGGRCSDEKQLAWTESKPNMFGATFLFKTQDLTSWYTAAAMVMAGCCSCEGLAAAWGSIPSIRDALLEGGRFSGPRSLQCSHYQKRPNLQYSAIPSKVISKTCNQKCVKPCYLFWSILYRSVRAEHTLCSWPCRTDSLTQRQPHPWKVL